jgi:hypothetical protein
MELAVETATEIVNALRGLGLKFYSQRELFDFIKVRCKIERQNKLNILYLDNVIIAKWKSK